MLYSNCIPIKGASKSVVFDLQKQTYFYIPNDLFKILENHRGKTMKEIKRTFQNKYDDIIDNYFKILIKNNVAFLTNDPESFPKIDKKYYSPFEITNAILDIGQFSTFDLERILVELSDIHCKYLQLRIFCYKEKDEILSLLEYLNKINSNTIGVDIFIKYEKDLEQFYHSLFLSFPRLNNLIVYSSVHKKNIISKGHSKYLIHTGLPLDSEKHCGMIDKTLFSINIKTFSEAQMFNSCLNGKISIDQYGEIKNCPSIKRSFGNINSTSLKDALKETEFKKYWTITKNQIEVCKDCEFRYVCTDCRAYTERVNIDSEIDLSKPLKCGYNPYTNKWEDWSLNPLKQKAIEYYFMNESKKING